MKVLMISYTSLIQELYHGKPRALAKLPDMQITALVPPFWKELWSSGRKELEIRKGEGYRIHVAPTLFTGNLHCAVFRNTIGPLLREIRPDIIDIEDESFNAGSAQLVWLRNRISPQSTIVMHASQSDFKRYPPPFNLFERYSLNHVSAFLARNREAVDVLRKKGYRGKTVILTHGVDPERFRADRNEARSWLGVTTDVVVGFVGALVWHKGLDTLLRAAQGVDCTVLLVGGGEYQRELLRLAEELGMSNRVKIVPPVSHRDVPRCLAAMDVFVLPSRTARNWRERFGRVLIEAMAAGIPVIGSSSGEIPEVLGEAGLIFPEDEPRRLEEHLRSLCAHPEERAMMAERGRARVAKLFSWELIARRTCELYNEVLGRS